MVFHRNTNCSQIYISKRHVIYDIKEKALSLNLPIMMRKWESVTVRTIKRKHKKYDIIEKLLNQKMNAVEIRKETKFNEAYIRRVIKKINMEKTLQ